MSIALVLCRCGSSANFTTECNGSKIYAICDRCKIRTPSKAASLETSAKQEVADIWNAGSTLWPRWIRPATQIDSYPLDAQVSHTTGINGAYEHWVSLEAKNVQEPGKAHWRLVGHDLTAEEE